MYSHSPSSDGVIKVEVDRVSRALSQPCKGMLGAKDNLDLWQLQIWSFRHEHIFFRQLDSRPTPSHVHITTLPLTVSVGKWQLTDVLAITNISAGCHLEGHTPSIQQDFARLIIELKKFGRKAFKQKTQREKGTGRYKHYREEDVRVRLARERGFTGFWQTVFEEIHGQEVMKQA